jgi:[protein-PII] uridylyltransferase
LAPQPAAAPAPPAPAAPLADLRALTLASVDLDAAVGPFRDALGQARLRLRERHGAGEAAVALVAEHATFVDAVLREAWRRALLDHGHALVAVGGYGRGELQPCSDIDILVLMARPTDGSHPALERFLAFLWDIGLEVGHGVRTVAECVEEAARDVTVVTTLMEARHLAGDPALLAHMREATGPDRIWPVREFFEAKRVEQRERHHRFDDTAYKLEPNVKEGPGGLRDIQMIGWVAKRHFAAESLHDLVGHGFLTEEEYHALSEGQAFLWEVRFTLHRLLARREDRLLFDHQRRLAAEFDYDDDDAALAVEKFMKRYYRTVMELDRLNEMLIELFQEAILLAGIPREVTSINRRFQIVNGFLEVKHDRVFRRYPFALLELFLILQQHPELDGVRASTIRLVRDNRHRIDDAFRADLRARSLFLEILRQPRGITHELRRMHRYGVLGAYLPVFGAVVGQMQYDLFHAYTVDEHTLFVVSNLRAFAIPERADEHPLAARIFAELARPHVLYIAGLFHDIGKGRGGDHSELGSVEVEDFCRQHGLGEYDTHLAGWLVRNHLVLSVTAQRRDISDPEVVNEFARVVGDRRHLDYLYLLTVADIRGTNPSLWNDWKDMLLRDLYQATLRALRRGVENPLDRAERIAETKEQARAMLRRRPEEAERAAGLWDTLGDDYFLRNTTEEIAWHARSIVRADTTDLPLVLTRDGRGGTDVFVYAPDREHLFAATTSVLGRLGLSIHDARIITADNGMTLDSFVVLELDGEPVRDRRRLAEIRRRVRLALESPGAERGRVDSRLPRRQLRHFETPTRVSFYDDEANARSVIEVVAGDRPGLLARIGWALADAGVRLQNAKIATFGERAEDVFFVTDADNCPLEPSSLDNVRRRITAAVDDAAPEE